MNGGFSYLSQGIVNYIWMLKMVIGEEVKLIKEVPNINATEWIHLGKW
jgi:hypothetical protein